MIYGVSARQLPMTDVVHFFRLSLLCLVLLDVVLMVVVVVRIQQ